MAREQLHDTLGFNFWFMSGQFGVARLEEATTYTLNSESHIGQFVEAIAPGTVLRLSPISSGKFFIVTNTGTEDLDIQSANGVSLFTLAPGEANLYHSEGVDWHRLITAGVTYSVFGGEGPGASDGLVPSPGAAQPDLRFLGSDAAWHAITTSGIADGFAHITDGTNTADASGADTFKVRSSSGKISAVVTNNEAVHGDNVNLSVVEGAVDHDALLNFVANKHIDHTSVTFTVGTGLTGGGDISANRTISFDFAGMTAIGEAVAANDIIPIYNLSGTVHRRTTVGDLSVAIDHDATVNFVANEHIDHSGVSINTGTGLSGGGNITATRTISLDFSALPAQAEAMASGDTFPFFDLSGAVHKKVSWGTINTSLDHDALTNFVGNKHIDHTAVTLTAGAGLTGGGDISASRSFAVGAGTGIVVNADDVAIDAATTTEVLTGTSTSDVVTPDALAALWEKGSNVASAGTVSFGEGGFFHITGTTTITDIDFTTAKDGRKAYVVFDGALTLTHNGTTLILPGAANIITAAGDRAIFVQDAGDNIICVSYIKADGTPIALANDSVTFAKMQNITSDRLIGRDTASSGDPEEISVTNGIEFTGSTSIGMSANQRTVGLVYVIDGGGSTITTGNKRGFRVPFACTILRWSIGLDQSGSVVIDIWKDTQANYPPVVGDTITASAKPTVTTATNATSNTLTGWTTSIAAGDYLFFNVDSVTSATWASIMLEVLKT